VEKLRLTLLVKDANTQIQSLSTQVDAGGNLVPLHLDASLQGGVAMPVMQTAPMPVINAAGSPAVDGSGTIAVGGTAQPLFSGIVPVNGFQVCNNSTAALYVSDVGMASAGAASMPVGPGSIYTTPDGYRPAGAVSVFGASTGQAFAARRW
jgi:hypothetical protein